MAGRGHLANPGKSCDLVEIYLMFEASVAGLFQLEFPKLFCYILEPDGAVAQSGERLTGSQKVVGSNPISSTSLIARKSTTELLEQSICSGPEDLRRLMRGSVREGIRIKEIREPNR
jgi:hypothetical protein